MYSKQKWYCQICGQLQDKDMCTSWHSRVCGKACWNEWEWRKTLSILGKEYSPDPRKYDENGDPIYAPASG